MGISERYLARGFGQGTRLRIKHQGFGASSALIYSKYGWNHHPLLWGKDIPPPRGDRLPETSFSGEKGSKLRVMPPCQAHPARELSVRDARIINHPGHLVRERQCPRTTCPDVVIAEAGFPRPSSPAWSV